jgi:hypothetical protein
VKLPLTVVDGIKSAIDEADTPVAALVAALRLTFIALGAGDLAAEHDDSWKIDGRDWSLDPDQWCEIGDALIKAGERLQLGGVERVNLGLDWMNLGPTSDERRAVA